MGTWKLSPTVISQLCSLLCLPNYCYGTLLPTLEYPYSLPRSTPLPDGRWTASRVDGRW